MKPTVIIYHEGIAKYDFGPGHHFRGDRFPRYIRLLEEKGVIHRPGVQLQEPRPAGREDLLMVHSEAYLEHVDRVAAHHGMLSPDTPLTPSNVEAARLIVGGALRAAELVSEKPLIAEAVGGGLHHAGRDYGGGFCIFNDVAVCAQALLDCHGLGRVLVFDTDAHAGNGTMDIFYKDPRVLFISVHQDPRTMYPGTGFTDQTGSGPGEGYTVNMPLPPGAGDQCMGLVLDRVFKPLVEQFRPQAIIRNGGPDPHYRDGLARLGLTYGGFWNIGSRVVEAADQFNCGVINMSCSGYNPATVANGMYALLAGLLGIELDPGEQERAHPDHSLYRETEKMIHGLSETLGNYWDI